MSRHLRVGSSTPSGREALGIFSLLITTFVFSIRLWTTLRICATVCRASSCVNLSSLWATAAIFFSPTSFPTSFSSFVSQVLDSLIDRGDGLTKVPPLCLFDRRRECGEQLNKNLDNHITRGFCGRDLGTDFEAIEEVPNCIEKIGQGTVVIRDAFDRLIRLNVTKMRARWQRLNIGTHRE